MTRGSRELHAIVLAGGRGRRLRSVTASFVGEPVPKQFCAFGGARTLLRVTLDRLRENVVPRDVTVVVDATQIRHAEADVAHVADVRVVTQPRDRGTAPGVLLPLMCVLDRAQDATVLVTPADHGMRHEERFAESVQVAREAVDGDLSEVVVLGVEPTAPNADYGWIVPGRDLAPGVRAVEGFVEKPSAARAEVLWRMGALWNTMVVVARGSGLWALFRETLSRLTTVFDVARRLHGEAREAYLRDAYARLEASDFCRDVLQRAGGLSVVTLPSELGWADLGTPERMQTWLEKR